MFNYRKNKKLVCSLLVLSAILMGQSASFADSYNYTAGATCVARSAGVERSLLRSNNNLYNKSTTRYAQVYCSAPSVEIADEVNVNFLIYGQQGRTSLPFKAAFRLYKPDTGQKLKQVGVKAPSRPGSVVQFGPREPLTSQPCCAYNQILVFIPPRSSLYTVYTTYDDGVPEKDKAYVFANQRSTAVYTPTEKFSSNTTGGKNQVIRTSAGIYRVIFEGVGKEEVGGQVQVSAHGNLAMSCRTQSWGGVPDVAVNVRCYNSKNQLTDAEYSVLYVE